MSDGGDKLARTRLAIIEHIYNKKEGRRDGGSVSRRRAPASQVDGDDPATDPPHRTGRFARLGDFTDAGREWWRQHPARGALELATPALSAYARRRPARFLGIAVVTGAVFMLTRPWRLLSVTGIALALLKSSQLPAMVMSAVSAAGYGSGYDQDDAANLPEE